MKIISWNVNSIRARIDPVITVLNKFRPDVLLLQETRVEDHAFPVEYFEDLGYNIALKGQKGKNGVAIFSKHILEEVNGNFSSEARYLEAFTGGVFVASVYVPNGQMIGAEQYLHKLDFLRDLEEKFAVFADEIFVAGGDFNVAPYPQDAPTPDHKGIMCSEPERDLIKNIRDAGFSDILEQKGRTWWDYRRPSNFAQDVGFRLDHFYLSSKANELFKNGEVIRFARELPRPSDHAPIICELSI
ncbi:MAG: endonuclease/exonuclease/phosphatase family protein [Holosporaceae bacterium]|jgi:exodeoxyribonuclease-3|nr:endonuclease/exonuclease/phosphatase family protein [Holosporaceae bacterium]